MKNKEIKKNIVMKGISASPGIVIAPVYLMNKDNLTIVKKSLKDEEIPLEIMRFEDALMKTKQDILEIRESIEKKLDNKHAEIFSAHILVLEDRMILEDVLKKIKTEKLNVEYIYYQVLQNFIETFSTIEDRYIKERVSDIKDIGKRVLRALMGKEKKTLVFKKDVICVAYDIAPSDTALINKEKVLGFATDIGSRTSHTAIMARSFEIPAVVGLKNISQYIMMDDIIILDGSAGKIILNPDKKTISEYREKQSKFEIYTKKLEELRHLPALTKDGHKVDLVSNIEFSNDVINAKLQGTDGIGLFRTEFFYMNRMDLPTEEEHFCAYKIVAEQMAGKSVIIRTLDLGGDKFLSQLDIPQEMNPFLGWRAIRFCLERLDIFKVQLKAILRASVYGNISLMYPMISCVEEFKKANDILSQVKQSLKDSGIPFNENIKVGAMIEIPSAAITADILAKEADFFSIGTNDLIQYSLAVDRINEKIAYLYQPAHPAILRLIKNVVDAAHKENIPVGMCGEMSSEALYTVLLLGLGLDSFSVSAVILSEIKKVIRSVTKKEAIEFSNYALSLSTAGEIESCAKKMLNKILPEKKAI